MLLAEYALIKDLAADILEGGAGSGHYGHKGRPGKRGGSLPGGGVSALISGSSQRRITSTQMGRYLQTRIQRGRYTDVRSAANRLRERFPGQPDDRYGRALRKAGFTKDKVLTAVAVTPMQAISISRARPRAVSSFGIRKAIGVGAQGAVTQPNLQKQGIWDSLSRSVNKIATANGMTTRASITPYGRGESAGFSIGWTKQGRSAGSIGFSLDSVSKTGYISGFFMSPLDQGTGFGMNVIDAIVKHAQKAGVERIGLLANGGEGIGRYAWAAMGFDFAPSRREGEGIRFKAWLKGKNVDVGDKVFRHSWEIAGFRTPELKLGKDYLIRHHESYDASFDVRPGSKSLMALENYMAGRKLSGDKKDKAA